MGANAAGIYGAQIFRSDDRPRYRRGFSINIAVLSLGVSLAVVRYGADVLERRKRAKKVDAEEEVGQGARTPESPRSEPDIKGSAAVEVRE